MFQDPATGKYYGIKPSTGEVVEFIQAFIEAGSRVLTPDSQAANKERQKKRAEAHLRQSAVAMQTRELGNYCFVSSGHRFELSPATMARLIYLSTFMKYNSACLYRTLRTPLYVKDLSKVLGISRNSVTAFLEEAHEYLTVSEGGTIEINTAFFRRGALENETHDSFRRIYFNGVRSLYRSTPVSKHRYAGYVFLLLANINIEHNILCWNPVERVLGYVQPMTAAELCEAVHYNQNQVSRLCKELAAITFPIDGKPETLCSFVCSGNDPKLLSIYINPRITYSGNDYRLIDELTSFQIRT